MKQLGRVFWFMGWLASAAFLHAQETQITGQVRDSSQVAIAGAKVTLTRVETGDHHEVMSAEAGYHCFPLLLAVGSKLAAFYPLVNAGTSPTGQFVANDPATTVVDDYVARIDHLFSQKDRIFGRFLGQPDHTLEASVFPTPGTDPLGYLQHDYYYNLSGNWFHNFMPNTINELILTYTRRQAL
jgi:hypothetical protein